MFVRMVAHVLMMEMEMLNVFVNQDLTVTDVKVSEMKRLCWKNQEKIKNQKTSYSFYSSALPLEYEQIKNIFVGCFR